LNKKQHFANFRYVRRLLLSYSI